MASSTARLLAALIAFAVFAALALQTTLNLERDGSTLTAFLLLLRFFTIWSNLAAAIIMARIAMGGRVPQPVLFSLVTALTIVAIVYWALLAVNHHPVGLDRVTNQVFHTVAPAAVIAWWLAFTRSIPMRWGMLPWVMVAPVVYTGFMLVYGAMSGFYPYFFLDLPSVGWAQLAFNVAGLSLVFLIMGGALGGMKRLLTARA